MILTSLAESVKQCGRDQTVLNRFEPVLFAQCGQSLRLSLSTYKNV